MDSLDLQPFLSCALSLTEVFSSRWQRSPKRLHHSVCQLVAGNFRFGFVKPSESPPERCTTRFCGRTAYVTIMGFAWVTGSPARFTTYILGGFPGKVRTSLLPSMKQRSSTKWQSALMNNASDLRFETCTFAYLLVGIGFWSVNLRENSISSSAFSPISRSSTKYHRILKPLSSAMIVLQLVLSSVGRISVR